MVEIPIMACKPSLNLSFSSLFRYLTLGRVSHFQTLYITNVSSEEEPWHLLIYHYILDYGSILEDIKNCCCRGYSIFTSMLEFSTSHYSLSSIQTRTYKFLLPNHKLHTHTCLQSISLITHNIIMNYTRKQTLILRL